VKVGKETALPLPWTVKGEWRCIDELDGRVAVSRRDVGKSFGHDVAGFGSLSVRAAVTFTFYSVPLHVFDHTSIRSPEPDPLRPEHNVTQYVSSRPALGEDLPTSQAKETHPSLSLPHTNGLR